ncbi:recombinase family protein [Metapseudomonas boanensis]|uniref:Recombinase family protein n=1 Tax=Metapseudomonas boanensis TaxID=2822138 RepID=A0ABS5XGE4_9GAMM|nr:recombinase family protein [Pseudomonas boanensis]MBT8766758.1 recombinase family protein [Pseudomonas boanensis]
MPTGQFVGYARTSTADQEAGLEAQLRELERVGCEKIFSEKVSSVAQRPRLQAALDYCREGDTFVVTKIDRLARSVADLLVIVAGLTAKKVRVKILSPDLDTETPAGKLMLNIFGAVAQFEREIMLERQREGIQRARDKGKYKGRKPTSESKREAVLLMLAQGAQRAQVARDLGIGIATVYRIQAQERDKQAATA